MSYLSHAVGKFHFEKPLDHNEATILAALATSSRPPEDAETLPSGPCLWRPTSDLRRLVWIGRTQLADNYGWLDHISKNYLSEWGNSIRGVVSIIGEFHSDCCTISANAGKIEIEHQDSYTHVKSVSASRHYIEVIENMSLGSSARLTAVQELTNLVTPETPSWMYLSVLQALCHRCLLDDDCDIESASASGILALIDKGLDLPVYLAAYIVSTDSAHDTSSFKLLRENVTDKGKPFHGYTLLKDIRPQGIYCDSGKIALKCNLSNAEIELSQNDASSLLSYLKTPQSQPFELERDGSRVTIRPIKDKLMTFELLDLKTDPPRGSGCNLARDSAEVNLFRSGLDRAVLVASGIIDHDSKKVALNSPSAKWNCPD